MNKKELMWFDISMGTFASVLATMFGVAAVLYTTNQEALIDRIFGSAVLAGGAICEGIVATKFIKSAIKSIKTKSR